jgi:NADH-quinone oxidoreductase subunit G
VLDNGTDAPIVAPAMQANGVERAADVPLYFSDPLVRRSPPLQQTRDARSPQARMHASLLERIGIAEGAQVRVRQGRGEAVVSAVVDPAVPPGVVRLGAAHPSTCGLDGMSGPITVERA